MYAITVEFLVDPERVDEFMKHILRNATAARETEPGCKRFEVCVDPARPDRIFLYELYVDRAAFEAHMSTAHFRAFGESAREMILEKKLETWTRVSG